MHEISIISYVIDMVEEQCIKNNITKVAKVILQIGEFSCIDNSSIDFIFKEMSSGSCCEGAKLIIEKLLSKAYCNNCHKAFPLKITNSKCPICNHVSSKITSGYEILLYRIEGE